MYPNFAIANSATYHIYTSPSKHERERERRCTVQYALSLSTDRQTSYTTTANISLDFILHNQQIFIELCIELFEQLYCNLNIQIHTTGGLSDRCLMPRKNLTEFDILRSLRPKTDFSKQRQMKASAVRVTVTSST